ECGSHPGPARHQRLGGDAPHGRGAARADLRLPRRLRQVGGLRLGVARRAVTMAEYTATVSENATADPLVGRLLDGRYQIRSRIARGGMATVYLATDLRLERRVAVKVMHGHLADDAAFRERFIR